MQAVQPRRRRRRPAAAAAVAAVLLLLAAPASAVRAVLSEASCSDLVPGSFTETVAEAPPGGSAAVAYYQDAGPIYVVAAADDGASSFAVEIRSDGSSTVQAEAVATAGCATTPVVDMCAAAGPASLAVVLRCQDQDQPCRVRMAVYLSACPRGPQPQVVGAGDPAGKAAAASPPLAGADQQPGGSSAPEDAGSDGGNSGGSGGLAGISSSTWIIVGVAAAGVLAAALALWCLCRRCRRRRQHKPPVDPELGNSKWGPVKPVKPAARPPPPKPQQQQFMVSGAATAAPSPPAAAQQQAQWAPPPAAPQPQPQQQQLHAGPAAQGWSFAYKVAKSRLTFATEATQSGGALTPVPDIDAWVAAVLTGGGRRWEGCLMWNDDPPPGCGVRPVPYNSPGHTKGVLLWGGQRCGYLVHSVPKWPAAPPAGASCRQLSRIEQPQTERGQSFLWVELPRGALQELLAQLRHMQALVYHASDSRVWPWAPTDYTKWQQQGSALRQIALGPGMWHVAQSGAPPTDFFDHLAVAFGGGWLVRTNLGTNASARVPSGSRVANITQFAPPGHTHAPYLAGSEHAKLGVCCSGRAPGAPPPPLCLVGDLNNTTAQWKRGGGAVVLRHPHLTALLRQAATHAHRRRGLKAAGLEYISPADAVAAGRRPALAPVGLNRRSTSELDEPQLRSALAAQQAESARLAAALAEAQAAVAASGAALAAAQAQLASECSGRRAAEQDAADARWMLQATDEALGEAQEEASAVEARAEEAQAAAFRSGAAALVARRQLRTVGKALRHERRTSVTLRRLMQRCTTEDQRELAAQAAADAEARARAEQAAAAAAAASMTAATVARHREECQAAELAAAMQRMEALVAAAQEQQLEQQRLQACRSALCLRATRTD
ncbi:deoxyribonuclease-2-alpha [Micractinium conductrix]|uniref:Deoxyribonuclease-2-alpha n=1 Tax=Micractinium conductrix TaxID=554055 RepID=A0A2P6VHV0_9CHLO|nr:deoxyribonuclease-2-alpha [Micractinium conductrix]|eukprot:PSC73664.1 deoxyribonuclease-2-alpha [Micractinium conductrix]